VNPIPLAKYAEVVRRVRESRNYAKIDATGLQALKVDGITNDQIISIRNVAIKDKIISNYYRMNSHIGEVTRKYLKGVDILELSRYHDFPPRNLLRGILLKIGYSSRQIYSIFANKTSPDDLLSTRDWEQFHTADEHDAERTINQREIAVVAASNEDAFVKFFVDHGIELVTQEFLVEKDMAEHGRAVNTPDILFVDTVFINDRRVHWIDYKDYVGTRTNFLYTSNKKQVGRYANAWGPGALCFHHNFVDNMKLPKTQMLDAGTLPIDLKMVN